MSSAPSQSPTIIHEGVISIRGPSFRAAVFAHTPLLFDKRERRGGYHRDDVLALATHRTTQSPLKVVREIIVHPKSPGDIERDVFFGDVDFRHGNWWSERITTVKDHWEEWRDKERIWSIGAGLKSSFHNRGIGCAALSTLFREWGIAQIGATEVRAETFVSNMGSNRIWEKLGFVKVESSEQPVIVPKIKTGGEAKEEKGHLWVWALP
ncbi:hypothetical protein D9757_005861 [Collybiopsis confluens]|uniref:N-acetyltransferase domain-containing protein n=1 Tax=Collybiopsis confluens TaxID=2823264 RepID=A0A8H5M9P0_9AGAR|nr:hypothetical protein D9757_005861 [Collybiopsis confluens]